MVSELAAVAFGLASAASWGAGDFSGGLATRRTNVFGVVIFSQMAGLAVAIALAMLRSETLPTVSDILWGAGAGVVGSVGLVAFYRALAKGQMGLAAPLAAVVTATLPVIFAALSQGVPQESRLAGFGLALFGVWLLARPTHMTASTQGLGLAMLAGVGFGGFLILMGHVGPGKVFWPLAVARLTSLTILFVVALSSQREWRPTRQRLPLIFLAGMLDMGGNAFYMLAVQAGSLDVAAVLSSLYPASTVLLAGLILRERVSGWQAIGMLAALIAVPLIAA